MRSGTLSVIAIITVLLLGTAPVFAQDEPAAAPATLPFPAGARIGYVDLQRVLAGSAEGQASNTRVQELTDEKIGEIEARNNELQAELQTANQLLQDSQQKLAQGESVMSGEARINLQREISRMQLDMQRQTQDAQAEMERVQQDAQQEIEALQQELQIEFETLLSPAIDEVATEKGLDFLMAVGPGVIWANRSLDLTQAVIDKLNVEPVSP
ncbi:OmpH family outer membrane protein [bacterium]|nr:MAG: OmpH family outer membrane protein [bacterium]